MTLNAKLLTETPLTQKGVFFYPGNSRTSFGLIHTISLEQHLHPERFGNGNSVNQPEWLQVNLPDVFEQITGDYPEDVQIGWYSDDYNRAFFVMYALKVNHELKLPFIGDDFFTNDAILLLLSGMLQTGEKPNHRNMVAYRRLRGIKYLPLTIGRENLYFHVYLPTAERIEIARQRFEQVVRMIKPLLPKIPKLLKLIYSAVRLSEVSSAAESVNTSLADVQESVNQIIAPYTKQFGFVYQDMPKLQDAKPLYYEMLSTD